MVRGTAAEIAAKYGPSAQDPEFPTSEDEHSSSESSDEEYTPAQSPAPDPIDEHGNGIRSTNNVAAGACSPSLSLSSFLLCVCSFLFRNAYLSPFWLDVPHCDDDVHDHFKGEVPIPAGPPPESNRPAGTAEEVTWPANKSPMKAGAYSYSYSYSYRYSDSLFFSLSCVCDL